MGEVQYSEAQYSDTQVHLDLPALFLCEDLWRVWAHVQICAELDRWRSTELFALVLFCFCAYEFVHEECE